MSAHHQQQQHQDGAAAYNIPPEPTTPGTRAARDQDGACYYDGPIPGFADGAVYPFRQWEDHIDYLFFAEPTKNRNGGQVVYIKPWKGAREAPRIQLVDLTYDQALRVPFPLRGRTEKDGVVMGSDERPNLELSLDNAEALEAFLRRVDATIRRAASGSRFAKWFRGAKPTSRDSIIGDNYKPIVADPPPPQPGQPDKGYRPTVRTKLSLYNDRDANSNTLVWQATQVAGGFKMDQITDRAEIFARLKANVRVVPIVEITSLWFMTGNSWGVTVQMSEIVIMPSEERQRGVFHGMTIVNDDPQAAGGSPHQGNSPTVSGSPSGDVHNNNDDGYGAQYDGQDGMPMDVVGQGFGAPADGAFPAFDGPA
ncbi:hypothetical protein pneo_cds_270 [Pandoravirus neocaledonia]|uniref:Uncharacterized protein n=1 Tax=Pandoravirus neocaledonia TaxID=2107708 RepID=A0A2U7UBP9_9VIRU|nr:hypothetical protein pneo_cds_270 [Pandoravirus neocaledonia]AVK75877.1 hypothetical protein pneo_cds_270 [Pandoravirus neocaledonia]